MATKVTSKKAKSVNNRPNCLKITKSTQKVNFTTIIDKDGNKIKADHKVQYAVAEEITPEMVESLRYKMGVNELYVGKGLIDILNEIERRYGLDFNSLEKILRKAKNGYYSFLCRKFHIHHRAWT